MVVFVLSIKADLEGVASVRFVPGSNLCFSVRNPLNDYEVREKVVIESDALLEEQPEQPSKHHPKSDHHRSDHSYHEPVCHFALKWEGATQRSTIQVILPPNTSTTTTSEDDDDDVTTPAAKPKSKNKASRSNSTVSATLSDLTVSGEFVPMLALECHGVEPYAFHPMGGEFLVTNNAGVQYSPEDVDLSTGYWREYDMASGTTSITKFESNLV
jgi:hypothetical protein